MVFYYFGPSPSSWAVGNDRFSMAKNLPKPIQDVWDKLGSAFQDSQMAGTRIRWMSSAPDGTYAILTKNREFLSNCSELLVNVTAQLKQEQHVFLQAAAVSPLGGWFAAYSNNTIQLGGRWPDAFYSLASPYVDLSPGVGSSPQPSTLQNIVCGPNGSVIVKAEGSLHWDGVHQDVAAILERLRGNLFVRSSYTITNATVLCPWSSHDYFIESKPYPGAASVYSFRHPADKACQELLQNVIEGLRPPQDLIDAVYSANLHHPGACEPAELPPSPKSLSFSAENLKHSSSEAQTPPSIAQPGPGGFNPSPLVPAAGDMDTWASDRDMYWKRWDAATNGRDFLTASEAAVIFLESGIDKPTLEQIWTQVDRDRDDQIDKTEFCDAMCHIKARLGGDNGARWVAGILGPNRSTRWTTTGIFCDGCSRGIHLGETTYHCSICDGGDLDICSSCFNLPSKPVQKCDHTLQQALVQLQQEPATRYVASSGAVCDGCSIDLHWGELVYCCSICNHGDYDICASCWSKRNFCGHPLKLHRLQARDFPTTDDHAMPHSAIQPQHPMLATSGFSADAAKPVYVGKPPSRSVPTARWDFAAGDSGRQLPDSELDERLLSSVRVQTPSVGFTGITGLEQIKEELKESIVMPMKFAPVLQGSRKRRRSMLLYGMAGAGKRQLAMAVAAEVNGTLISISARDIMSTWAGNSAGLVKKLLLLAQLKKPCIILIDGIEALSWNQDMPSACQELVRRINQDLLVEMDLDGPANPNIFVIATTDAPWDLDPPIRRRFHQRAYVPMPNEEERAELFKVNLKDANPEDNDLNSMYLTLGKMSQGLSPRDISELVDDARMVPAKKLQAATHFRMVQDKGGDWYTPCHASHKDAMNTSWDRIPAKHIKQPALTSHDVYNAVKKKAIATEKWDDGPTHLAWAQEFKD